MNAVVTNPVWVCDRDGDLVSQDAAILGINATSGYVGARKRYNGCPLFWDIHCHDPVFVALRMAFVLYVHWLHTFQFPVEHGNTPCRRGLKLRPPWTSSLRAILNVAV